MIRGLAASKPGCEAAGSSRTGRRLWSWWLWRSGGRATGRARMNVIPDFKASTIIPVLTRNIAPGSTIYTDGLKSFDGLKEVGFQHVTRIQPLRAELRKGAKSAVPSCRSSDW
jgi:hypothetical protein